MTELNNTGIFKIHELYFRAYSFANKLNKINPINNVLLLSMNIALNIFENVYEYPLLQL